MPGVNADRSLSDAKRLSATTWADVAVEDAAGLAQVQREVVALVVAVAVQVDRHDDGRDGDDARARASEGGRDYGAAADAAVGRESAAGTRRGVIGLRPRRWIAARRAATLSGLNIVRCHARRVARLVSPSRRRRG